MKTPTRIGLAGASTEDRSMACTHAWLPVQIVVTVRVKVKFCVRK